MPESESAEGLATAIYGTILSTALIAAYSEDSGTDPGQIALAVLVAALVFWVAHAYADLLAHGVVYRRSGGLSRFRVELAAEWPMVTGALLPTLPLMLSPLGLLSDDAAEDAAIATGVALLGVVGIVIAVRRGSGIIGVALSATSSLLFGVIVVALKALVH
jgi:hypothetical protein